MPPKVLDVLMLGRCSHEFSWPRRTGDGDYYQVCTLCAAEYKYDWKTMRRTERVDPRKAENAAPAEAADPAGRRAPKPTWVPRARRLTLALALRYRVKNVGEWYAGQIDNLSQSGLLFRGPQSLPERTLVEMIFDMPEEISGQRNSTVLCQGRIIRTKEPEKQAGEEAGECEGIVLAASILDYIFLHSSK